MNAMNKIMHRVRATNVMRINMNSCKGFSYMQTHQPEMPFFEPILIQPQVKEQVETTQDLDLWSDIFENEKT